MKKPLKSAPEHPRTDWKAVWNEHVFPAKVGEWVRIDTPHAAHYARLRIQFIARELGFNKHITTRVEDGLLFVRKIRSLIDEPVKKKAKRKAKPAQVTTDGSAVS